MRTAALLVCSFLWISGCTDESNTATPSPVQTTTPTPTPTPDISGSLPPSINDSTLLGTDADQNGIRDDIDEYIENRYSNDVDALRNMQRIAAAEQRILALDISSPDAQDEIFVLSDESSKSALCLIGILDNPIEAVRLLDVEIYNNTDRIEHYSKFDNLLNGTSWTTPGPSDIASFCNSN